MLLFFFTERLFRFPPDVTMVTISVQFDEYPNNKCKNDDALNFLYVSLPAFASGRLEPDSAPLSPTGQG